MNKNLKRGFGPILLLLIVAAIAIIGGSLIIKSNKANNEVSINTTATTTAKTGSLKDFFALGGSQICTFNNTAGGASSKGTIYVGGATKMRGDFTVESIVGTTTSKMESHMIRNGDDVYFWSGLQGGKMSLTGMMDANGNVQGNQPFDINQSVNYSCSNWNIDDSKFIVPAEVKFMDLSAVIQGGIDSQMNSCAACENAPEGSARNQCKAALGCK